MTRKTENISETIILIWHLAGSSFVSEQKWVTIKRSLPEM